MTNMATPEHKKPLSVCHEIYNFNRPLLGHHYYTFNMRGLFLGIEKKILKEIIHVPFHI